MNKENITIIYDGDCPFCHKYVYITKLKSKYSVEIINARDDKNKAIKFKESGYNLDKGFLLIHNEKIYHGDKAIKFITSQSDTTFHNLLLKPLFSNSLTSFITYKMFTFIRSFTFYVLGIPKIYSNKESKNSIDIKIEALYFLNIISFLSIILMSTTVWLNTKIIDPFPVFKYLKIDQNHYQLLFIITITSLLLSLIKKIRFVAGQYIHGMFITIHIS